MVKYVDDTTEYEVCHHDSPGQMQDVVNNTSQWSQDNKMAANPTKTKEMIINFSRDPPNIPNLIIE